MKDGATSRDRIEDLRFTKAKASDAPSEGSERGKPDSGTTVAALYVDPRGPYPKMPGVDCWDADRDAENYAGPWPVVAHPPCGPWSRLRHLYRGTDMPCGLVAAMQVRRWGGILEQPAGSRLWDAAGLPLFDTDVFGGFTVTVDQCDFGHVARKSTWLYMVGVDPRRVTVPAPRVPTHWCSGGRTKRPGMGATVPPGIKVCSAQQRRRTPPLFAEWLVELARSVRRTEAA